MLPCVKTDVNDKLPPLTKEAQKKITKQLGKPVKTLKIPLRPRNRSQLKRLQRYFGCVRWTYNQAVSLYQNAKRDKGQTWLKFLRAALINSTSAAVQQYSWLMQVGYDIRDGAIQDLLTAVKACQTKVKQGDLKEFRLSYRSRKRLASESLFLRKKYIEVRGNRVLVKWPNQPVMTLHCGRFRGLPRKVEMDCRLQRTSNNDFYLCVPTGYTVPNGEKEVETQDLRVASLDPGVRTFQTIYDPSRRRCIEVGAGDMKAVVRLCVSVDKLMSAESKTRTSRERYMLRRVARRVRKQLRNKVDEVHKQLVRFLTSQYDLILLPKFEVSQMIRKRDRKLRTKTARQMATWAHYRFRTRLESKCRERGVKLMVVSEAYTSKTCSQCGKQNSKLGGSKWFRCRRENGGCGMEMDRDKNGAKNILLRNWEVAGLELGDTKTKPSEEGA